MRAPLKALKTELSAELSPAGISILINSYTAFTEPRIENKSMKTRKSPFFAVDIEKIEFSNFLFFLSTSHPQTRRLSFRTPI